MNEANDAAKRHLGIDPKTLMPCAANGVIGDSSADPIVWQLGRLPFKISMTGDLTTASAEELATAAQAKLLTKFLKFLPDARAARGRSKDRSTKVGAVVIDDDFNVRVSGYNGMARGVNDNVEDRHQRPQKYLWAAHSEENCVAQAARVGVSLKGCTILLTSLFPCATCSRLIIQSGIKRILAPSHNDAGDGKVGREDWDAQFRVSKEMLAEAGVEVLYYEVPK